MIIVSFRELLFCGYAQQVSWIVVSVTYIIVSTHNSFQTAVMVNKPLFCFLSQGFVVNLSTKTSFPRRMVNPTFNNRCLPLLQWCIDNFLS